MFGMGLPEIILILALALIVIGPKKLPDLAKSMGKMLREFKSAAGEIKESISVEPEMEKLKKAYDGMNDDISDKKDSENKKQSQDKRN